MASQMLLTDEIVRGADLCMEVELELRELLDEQVDGLDMALLGGPMKSAPRPHVSAPHVGSPFHQLAYHGCMAACSSPHERTPPNAVDIGRAAAERDQLLNDGQVAGPCKNLFVRKSPSIARTRATQIGKAHMHM